MTLEEIFADRCRREGLEVAEFDISSYVPDVLCELPRMFINNDIQMYSVTYMDDPIDPCPFCDAQDVSED